MGVRIEREHFEAEDYAHFVRRLEAGLDALAELLRRDGFGDGPASLGAELELNLIDADGRPLPINRAVLGATLDPRVQLELDQFNLEYNAPHVALAGRPFTAMASELGTGLAAIGRAAEPYGGQVATIGILPTLRAEDLTSGAMSDVPRFRALAASLRRLRQKPFELRIDGEEPLTLTCDEITFEGANTSLQIHLRVPPDRFARTYNAVQLATPLAIAVAANSPLFVGHRLWDETRIALFKQAVDDRGDLDGEWRPPARVSFGYGWVRDGALELFRESATLYPPLLPISGSEDLQRCLRNGGVPTLSELRLHQSTVWRWNRAVYDCAEGGHLRIEMRALPAGPTVTDMTANAAFLVGLSLGLAEEMDRLLPSIPFEAAHRNFYRAAQHGLNAVLLWPRPCAPSPAEMPVRELIGLNLEIARRGLEAAGVEPAEVQSHLRVIEQRCASGHNGAHWQTRTLRALERRSGGPRQTRERREARLRELVQRYQDHSRSGLPVHEWPEELD